MSNAYCEACAVTVQIAVEDLLESDCSCPQCGSVLVLVEEEAHIDAPGGNGSGPLSGEQTGAPPLPAFDGGDTQQVQELAKGSVPEQLAAPVDVDANRDALEVLETVEVQAPDELARAWTEAPEPEPTPPAELDTQGWDDLQEGPAEGLLFPEDPDWAALIEESLPELEEEDENARRVMIRLPAEAALQNDADVSRLEGVFDAYGIEAPKLLSGQQAPTEDFVRGGGAPTEDFVREGAPTQDFARQGAPTQDFPREARPPSQVTRTAARPLKSDPPDLQTRKWEPGQPDPTADSPPAKRRRRSRRFARAETPPPPLKVIESVQFDQLDVGLVCARHPESREAESYLQLFHRLPADDGPRVVLVTSPTRHDGRTTVAANLSLVAARTGGGGVLVDADLHGRGALTPFGLQSSSTGLLNLLRTRGDPRRFVLQFRLGDLDVVPLGTAGRDAAELLCSDDMGAYLDELRDLYPRGLIVVDGSPVLEAASPLAITRHVDGVILVVRKGASRRDAARRAARILDPERLLGIVFNDN